MPTDPISYWMQASMFWISVMRYQQEAYLRALGAFAATLPHDSAADIAAQAEAVKATLKPARARAPKAAARMQPVPA